MKNRMHKIFKKDKKTFILALDHGISLNVLPELNDTGNIIKIAVDCGVDAIICTYGIYKKYSELFRNVPAIIRADGGESSMSNEERPSKKLLNASDVLRAGGESIVCMGFPGAKFENESITNLQDLICESDEWNLPLCAEMLPVGWNPKDWTPEKIKFSCRMGAELGADYIKTQYTGDKKTFKEIVEGCYVPVVILGGSGDGSIEELFNSIKDSIEVGGAGVAIGRTIWKQKDPSKYCIAIRKLVHEGIEVSEALKIIE